MKKIIFIIALICTDIILFIYLKDISESKSMYAFNLPDNKYLIQLDEIKLNSINEFDFDKYFKIIGLNLEYVYEYDEQFIYITIDDNKYQFKYEIIKPKVVEKVIYKEVEKPVITQEIVNNRYFYVDNNKLTFLKDTDLDYIRKSLISNLHTTYQTNIDYSRLNVSHVGQYSVFYITESERIEIIVEIT